MKLNAKSDLGAKNRPVRNAYSGASRRSVADDCPDFSPAKLLEAAELWSGLWQQEETIMRAN